MPCKSLSYHLVAGALPPPNAGNLSQRVRPSILLLGFQLQRSNDSAETFVVVLEHAVASSLLSRFAEELALLFKPRLSQENHTGNCRRTPSGMARVKSLKRPHPAGWPRQWRRSGTADARSGTARRAAMNESVASELFHLRPWEQGSGDGRTTENGPARLSSRDTSENNNARVVQAPLCSGIIAAI